MDHMICHPHNIFEYVSTVLFGKIDDKLHVYYTLQFFRLNNVRFENVSIVVK